MNNYNCNNYKKTIYNISKKFNIKIKDIKFFSYDNIIIIVVLCVDIIILDKNKYYFNFSFVKTII